MFAETFTSHFIYAIFIYAIVKSEIHTNFKALVPEREGSQNVAIDCAAQLQVQYECDEY